MLAVKVDYESRQATIGTESGEEISHEEILRSLESIGYGGKFAKE